MIVCVVGSGAREHALSSALARSAEVIATPGNPGITGGRPGRNGMRSVATPPEQVDADLYVIGPEAPLVDGLADRLRARGSLVVGPGALGARLEGSKAFMKELAADAGVPTAAFGVFESLAPASDYLRSLAPPYVVKTDGLAAGKGVLVTYDLDEAIADVADKLSGAAFGDAGRRVVIEEAMSGPELSLLVLTDGSGAVALPAAQDHKRIGEGETGPNTGGMGAYSPVPVAPAPVCDEVMERIVFPTLHELTRRGIEYRGILYAGCMLTEQGPKLVEFNIRLGDPEAEVVLPLLTGDVAELFRRVAAGQVPERVEVSDASSVCVVAAAPGYPVAPVTGGVISGLEEAGTVEQVSVFHAGTAERDGELVTAGGRVLAVSATGVDLHEARSRAYQAMERISFPGMQYRRDIAARAIGADR